MQNYYLHQELTQSSSIRNLQMYRYDHNNSYLIGSRGNSIEMYRLFLGELSFVDRFKFHANICRIEVIPSKQHKFDYLFVVDCKGRFCVWHQGACDFVENVIFWQNQMEAVGSDRGIYSGVNCQFEERDTVGVVFYSNGVEIVLVQFGVNLRGVNIDANSIIKYSLPAFEIRHIGWVNHSDSLFLLGTIFQQAQKTIFSVYNLQKGLGICEQSLQWSLQKVNLLQFYSQNPGQILIMTYNQISLHRYKNHYPLKNYRTRGNYGQGFIVDNEFYGHVGEEFILFSKEKLKTYGQIRQKTGIVFDNLGYSKRLDEKTVLLQTYQGGTYLLYINKQTFQLIEIFAEIGQILEIQPLDEGDKFITINQCKNHFSVNVLQPQLLIPLQTEQIIQLQKIQKVFSIKGGMFLIICSQNLNQVHRLNKANIYEFYVEILIGNILAAQQNFIVYEDGIYQVDYQSQTLTKVIDKQIIISQIMQEDIYYLTSEGYLLRLNEEGDEQLILQDRQNDYCWGKIIKSNTLLTANLSQNRQITLITNKKCKELSIKGHTLISCMSSIQIGNRRSNNDKMIIGYIDGQIHVHDVDLFHSILILDVIANSPPKLCIVSNQSIIAYYGNRQVLITSIKNQIKSVNLSINISNRPIHFIHYIHKSQLLCYIKQQQIDKKSILRQGVFPKFSQTLNFHTSLCSMLKLDEWSNSVPLLKKIDDRLLIAGANEIKIYRLQNGKIINKMKHILQQIISIIIIKLGIILCGVYGERQILLLITQDLQIKAQFTLNSNKPLRKIRNCVEDNQFIMGYSDYIAIFKITDTLQLVSIIGSKIDLQSYHIDLYQSLILVNDPMKKLTVYKIDEAISHFGGFMPAYTLTDAMFLEGDLITIDEKGTFVAYYLQREQNIEQRIKFSKTFSINISDTITTTNKQKNQLFYASKNGKIGIIRTISRQQFDRCKKSQSITLSSFQKQALFSYWQWRSRSSVPEKLIDYPLLNIKQDPFLNMKI